MKTTYIYGPRDIRVEDSKDSAPGPGQVLLDVTAVGICGSDLHTFLHGNIGGIAAVSPLTLGHEAAGRVIAVGEGVESLKVGQRVAIDPATPCGHCERCEAGQPHLCLNLQFMGLYPYHGALAERMVHPAQSCVAVPDSISDIGAAMLEPLGVALHASRLAKIEIGEDVSVIGCGGIGLFIIQLARLAGARHIFAIDKHPWRLALASNYGADIVLNASEVNVTDEVLRVTNKRGVDVAIEAAWMDETVNECVEMARYGGRVILVGIPVEDEFKVRASVARRKELLLQPSRRMKHTYPAAIALGASGQVDLEGMATHRFALDDTAKAFDIASTYADGVVRAMVLPNQR